MFLGNHGLRAAMLGAAVLTLDACAGAHSGVPVVEPKAHPVQDSLGFRLVSTSPVGDSQLDEHTPQARPAQPDTQGPHGGLSSTGSFDRHRVDRAIQRKMPRIRACYDRAARRSPDLAGKLTVRFTIHPGGGVRGAEAIQNSTGSDRVKRCILSRLESMRFRPGPRGGQVRYEYPFVLGS